MSPTPGTIGLVSTPDLAGRLIRWATKSSVNHTFIVLGEGRLFEARPHGAGFNDLSAYPNAIYREEIILTSEEQGKIVASVMGLVGTPYNWLDIVALALWCLFGWKVPGFVRRRIESGKSLICSQLVDKVYEQAGIHLFTDGRPPGAVTPGDLMDVDPGP